VPRLLYGGDYNPEQWPEEVWLEDARLMQEAGVNLVSLGIFSWPLLEPEQGVYEFAWLDRVIDLLWSHGVAIDLATPSAAAPAWLVRAHPEILPVTADGVRLEFGSRRHACPSSPVFREATVRMAEQLALRYGQHPALAMWHVSNEYACHLTACYCSVSAQHFRRWLQERYGELAELNRAWGTAFWGQRYSDWSQIEPPRRTPASVNPTQALDWLRFTSDAFLECFEAERAVLAELTPDIPATTNFMSLFQPLDHWTWASREDVVTIDLYPDPAEPEAHVASALNYDLMRGLANGESWLLLEHATSAVNWREVNVPKRPGLMRLWAHQAVARGSDGVMFFQWRAARAGSEKFHSAMLPHVGTDGRIWRETVALGTELARLEEVAGTTAPPADVACLIDWESWWALDGNDHPSALLSLPKIMRAWYGALHARNIPVDFAHPAHDLSGRRLVIAPNLYLAGDDALRSLSAYAEAGGVLVIGPFSCVVDPNDHIRLGLERDAVRRLLGARADEFWPLAPAEEVAVAFGSSVVHAAQWAEWLSIETAEPIAAYAGGPLDGLPAVTRHGVGKGVVYYCSAQLDAAGLSLLLGRACADAGVGPLVEAPAGVEVSRRTAADRSYLFVLNHNDDDVEVELPGGTSVDLLTGREVGGSLRLGSLGVAVLREVRRA
jgi:beta-galactosidase